MEWQLLGFCLSWCSPNSVTIHIQESHSPGSNHGNDICNSKSQVDYFIGPAILFISPWSCILPLRLPCWCCIIKIFLVLWPADSFMFTLCSMCALNIIYNVISSFCSRSGQYSWIYGTVLSSPALVSEEYKYTAPTIY